MAIGLATSLAIPAEGVRHYAYYDPPGVLTVCYGSTFEVEAKRFYSMEECKDRLSKEMLAAVEKVEKCQPDLPTPILAAFGDAVYNLGPTIACSTAKSTAARLLKKDSFKEACEQLPRWNQAKIAGVWVALPGLTSRRLKEKELCLTGV